MKCYTLVSGDGFVPIDFGSFGWWQGLACGSIGRTHRQPILGVVAGTTPKGIRIS